MKILVWHWGRFGAGPRFAAELAAGLRRLPGTQADLSLSAQAELLQSRAPPECVLPFSTYTGKVSFFARLAAAPWLIQNLAHRLRELGPDAAVCAMPAPLDLLMAAALRRLRIPFAVVIHDADVHPGDGLPLQMRIQRRLARRAAVLVALSPHVAARIRAQGLGPQQRLLIASHPPFDFGPVSERRAHEGPLRLLFFGRLLRYKGLDLLASALARLPPGLFVVRVVGRGPASPELGRLAAFDFVTVENRWVPEEEISTLLSWADAVVLPYREASQSGVAAGALAAGRWVVGTRVGGLEQQLAGEKLARLSVPEPAALADCLVGLAREPLPSSPTGSSHDTTWTRFAARLLAELTVAAPTLAPYGAAEQNVAGPA
jgi:glycosyltransferase involved in cell wall biosynthesis